jgi:hypothetical protein
MGTKFEQLLKPPIGCRGFEEPLPFYFKTLNAFSKSLVFGFEAGQGVVVVPESLHPVDSALRDNLQRPQNP